MHIIVCLDDALGMSFANRRQSMDRVLRARMLELVGEKRLWVRPYTAGQFDSCPDNLCPEDAFLEKAGVGEYCFIELDDPLPWESKLEDIVIYRWNRRYPSDRKFPAALLEKRKCVSTEEFAGSSHDTITQEVYRL